MRLSWTSLCRKPYNLVIQNVTYKINPFARVCPRYAVSWPTGDFSKLPRMNRPARSIPEAEGNVRYSHHHLSQ